MYRFIFVFQMAFVNRSGKGAIKRRLEKDDHGAATFMRFRDPCCNNPKIHVHALTPPSSDQLYLTKLRDMIEVGLF